MSGMLLAIDGDSLAHRAYHALPKSIRGGGRPANALVGFAQLPAAALGRRAARRGRSSAGTRSRRRPTGTRRCPATSPAASSSDAILEQLGMLPALVESFGFAVAKADGYEADDFLAAAAAALAGARGRRHLRPRRVPARERPGHDPAAGEGRERARADRARPRCASATASSPSRCRTSSRCAATRPTRSPARRASARRRRPTCSKQYGTLEAGARRRAVLDDRRRPAPLPRHRDDGRRLRRCPSSRPTPPDWARAAAEARELGLNALATRLAERGVSGAVRARQPPRLRRRSTRPGGHPESQARIVVLHERFSFVAVRAGDRGGRAALPHAGARRARAHDARLARRRHDLHRDDVRGRAARRRRRDRGGAPRRLRARAAAGPPRRAGACDGLLHLRLDRDRRALGAGRARARRGSRSSTGTSTTGTGRRRSSPTTPTILFVSLHQWPFYPGTGGPDEQGETLVNIPLAGRDGRRRLPGGVRSASSRRDARSSRSCCSSRPASTPTSTIRSRSCGLDRRRFASSPRRVGGLAPRVAAVLEGGYNLRHAARARRGGARGLLGG